MGSRQTGRTVALWLIESHPLAGCYLKGVLERNRAVEVVPASGDLPQGASVEKRPSLLVIDRDTLAVPLAAYLRVVRPAFPEVKVLAIGKPLPGDELCRLLVLGVGGFVPYDQVEGQIGRAVDAILKGHLWVPPEVLERYVRYSSRLSELKRGGAGSFTPRERLVLGLLERRLSNKEIGSALGISERTVRFHLQNIFDKVGVRDRHSVAEVVKSTDFLQEGAAEKARRSAT